MASYQNLYEKKRENNVSNWKHRLGIAKGDWFPSMTMYGYHLEMEKEQWFLAVTWMCRDQIWAKGREGSSIGVVTIYGHSCYQQQCRLVIKVPLEKKEFE